MIAGVFKKIFGSKNDRELKRMGKLVSQINQLEDEYTGLDDSALQAKTPEFKQRLEQGEALDAIISKQVQAAVADVSEVRGLFL